MAVSNNSDSGSIDSIDIYGDFKSTRDDKKSSWYQCPMESQGTLTDTSDLSLVATNSSQKGQYTLPTSGSTENTIASHSPQSLLNYSPTGFDCASSYGTRSNSTISTTTKAPPTASVVITTATATNGNHPASSSSISLAGKPSSPSTKSNRSHSLEGSSNNTIDHVRFLSPTISSVEKNMYLEGAPFTELATLGSNITVPMTKSKSLDSDTQSIATTFSISNTNSLGKILARLRGQKSNKEFWMPDEQCKECYKCRKQFTVFRRKHHCRLCGQIFCSKCASHIVPGKYYNHKGQVRICGFCYSEQWNDDNKDSVSVTPNSRLLSSPPPNYELSDTNIDNNDTSYSFEDTCQPVIPCQNPSLVAPMMQIPTTAVKKPANTQYGDNNSTTVALELSDHNQAALLDDGRNHHHHLYPGTRSTPSPLSHHQDEDSLMATGDGMESGSLKKLIGAGNSMLNSRSWSTLTASPGTSTTHGASSGTPSLFSKVDGRFMDHGGGMAITESPPSPFFCPENGVVPGEEIHTPSDNNSDPKYKIHRSTSISCLPQGRPSTPQRSSLLRHGQSTSTLISNQVSLHAANDNELYDGNRWTRRTPGSHGNLAPLRRQSITNGRARKDRFGHLHINTTGLVKSDLYSHENWSPIPAVHNNSRLNGDTFYGLHSPLTPLPSATNTSMVSSPTICGSDNNTADQQQHLTQGVKSKLLKIRHRRSSAPSTNPELCCSALGHAQNLLRQLMLGTSLRDLTNSEKTHWETVIMDLLLKITNNVQPDVRAGDGMDLRHYVKIKKIPGGVPSDSFYVRGVMCSKHVAHKRMAKNITEPRILILLFSLDYSRVEMENQLLSIQPVISQEREHINKLVGRIIALKPSLLLVKSTVSRLALEILLRANIPVVHNVKYSVIEAVARCTQASVVTSVDKLQGDLFFGHCGSFEIRTFLHKWIPHRRKTLLIFGDCAPELGGTVVLRGGTAETLKTVKWLMDFMVYVVYNLKLETSLLQDSFAKNRGLEKSQIVTAVDTGTMDDTTVKQLSSLDNKQYDQSSIYGSDGLNAFLKVYQDTILSTSHYELLEAQRHQWKCAWDAYLRECPDYVNPFYHQNIVVLYSNVCTVTTMPCHGPEIRVFEYYRYPSDITLGQYLLDLFADALEPCLSPMCNQPVMNHYLSYAHGDARINVITQSFECPVSGMSDKLLMWSWCKICEKATQVTRVSENTWNYSFGKFLELSLYQQGVFCRADICPHEMSRHHVRFFGYMDLSVGFQYETIDLLEVAVPSTKLFMSSQVQMDIKDAELKLLRSKIIDFYQSIIERNKAFPFDLVEPQLLVECKADLEDISDRATGSKKKMLQILQNIYATTSESDTLTINWVRRILYQEASEWDMEYTDLVRYYLLPERELLKITTSQLWKMFPAAESSNQSDDSGNSANIIGLSLLGFASDGENMDKVMHNNTTGSHLLDIIPAMLPRLVGSPTVGFGLVGMVQANATIDDTDKNNNTGLDTESLSLRPSIRRRLSLELNRELQLRFRVSDNKDDQPTPLSYFYPETRTPGPTAAALTPSRIPIPNFNLTSTSRSLLSPPLYDNLGSLSTNPRLVVTPNGNRIPVAPLKVPSSLELDVATPGLHLMPNKEMMSHRNSIGKGKRVSNLSELRLCLPGTKQQQQSVQDSNLTFMQQQQKQRQAFNQYRNGLQTQSLQHIPSMLRTQYTSYDTGRRGFNQRRITAPNNIGNNNSTTPSIFGRPGLHHQHYGQFKSRLPRRKTHIQVYTQANDLIEEDMDDEFWGNDFDDVVVVDPEVNSDKDNHSKKIDNNKSKKPTLHMPMPAKMMDMGMNSQRFEQEPIDYFSPQAPYSGTSGVTPATTDQDRINQSVAAAMASVPHTPLSIQTIISANTSGRPSLALDRLDTGPSTDSGTTTSLPGNQLPLASDLLSSPAAATTSKTDMIEPDDDRKTEGLPRNALVDRPTRRMGDMDEVKQLEKTSIVKTITNFLTDAGTGSLLPLKLPLNSIEHVMPDSFVIVREDEPSTIIAYTLNCDDYLKKIKEVRDSTLPDQPSNDLNTGPRTTETIANNLSASFDTEMTKACIQDTLLQESGSHVRYNFSDGNTKFFCKTFYTEQFDALRRQCGCDKSYILSLASCIKWDAVGGKSGSAFLKTKDDRFLMKQMSRFELDAFLSFAPAYFQYLSKAFFNELPTVLAKIFGFYSIGYKNSNSGKSMRMDVLVMENLFYQRNVKKIFDLKGSMRNRHVESTGKEDEVLLDENLVELIFQSPLFIRAHSKDILRSSLHNDTLFLSGLDIMDYSLLVGIDEERHELI
ncbi:hypothetical protein BC941DRAFT_458143 [Chlamydoabsidia padenii]|nr:hypothetical protein BC941DRAFT_458143 [Chlamydoabsidia padenii]